ncbi:MAG: hypothetical protein IKQ91_01835, partial [Oscillospiraceae bacterium]|nr:hypothetical protein [Oscillospiraceae bacterium]
MVTDKLKQYVLNDKHDLKTRVFVLMSTVMFFSWGFTLIETIITGRPLMHILLMAAAVTVFAAVCILTIRFSHIRLGAVLVAFGLCL